MDTTQFTPDEMDCICTAVLEYANKHGFIAHPTAGEMLAKLVKHTSEENRAGYTRLLAEAIQLGRK